MCYRVEVVVLGIARSRDMCVTELGGGLGNNNSRDMCDRVEVVVLGIARSRDMCVTELGWWSWE